MLAVFSLLDGLDTLRTLDAFSMLEVSASILNAFSMLDAGSMLDAAGMLDVCVYLLLVVGVPVHGAQGVLHPGQPGREAQQQADHPLQVPDEEAVALHLQWEAVLADQRQHCLPAPSVLLDLRLEGPAGLLQAPQPLLRVRHQCALSQNQTNRC